jgi:hypothetical protein
LKEVDPKLALAGAKLEQSQYDLTQRLFKAVSMLVDTREKLSLNVNSVSALEAQAMSARRAYELGIGTITDLRDTEVRLAQVRSQGFVIKAANADAERQYIALVGHAPSAVAYTLKSRLNAFRVPLLEDFLLRAEQRSPALRSTAVSITLAEIAKQKTLSALMPSVNAVAQISKIGGSPAMSNSSVSLRIDIPLEAGSFFKGANNFLRRTKLLSTVGAVGSAFIPQLRIPTLAARLTGYGMRHIIRPSIRVKKGKGRRMHRMRRMQGAPCGWAARTWSRCCAARLVHIFGKR